MSSVHFLLLLLVTRITSYNKKIIYAKFIKLSIIKNAFKAPALPKIVQTNETHGETSAWPLPPLRITRHPISPLVVFGFLGGVGVASRFFCTFFPNSLGICKIPGSFSDSFHYLDFVIKCTNGDDLNNNLFVIGSQQQILFFLLEDLLVVSKNFCTREARASLSIQMTTPNYAFVAKQRTI